MKYQEARKQIKNGDLLAFSHRESMWNSWYDFKIALVRMFSMSEFSHVGVAFIVGTRVMVLEAVTPKIRIYPLSKSDEFYWLPMNLEWKPDTDEFALSLVGNNYSQWQALLAYFGITKNDALYYCDEYARAIYEKEGLFLSQELMPTGLVRAVQKRGVSLHYVTQK